MYVAVKGGEQAIDNAHALLARRRRGDTTVPELSVEQIRHQMPLAVSRVMCEGSLFDEELAALAIKQAAGDLLEAIFLLRAYRTTLPRFMSSVPLQTEAMRVDRRISAIFKDLPGGQRLGPTFDYTHRLLDFTLLAEGCDRPGTGDRPEAGEQTEAREQPQAADAVSETKQELCPRVADMLAREGLLQQEPVSNGRVPDIT